MTVLWLDLETYSEVPIQNGTHTYAEHAEIMLFAYAFDDGPVTVWDCTAQDTMPPALSAALRDPGVLLYAHNSHFDRTVLRHALPDYPLPINRWRDTMVKALAHSLPGALGDLCDILKVPVDKAKDKAGKQFIQLFCKPRPANSKIRRATGKTHPVEWGRFVEYAGLDIEAMREVNRKLPDWNYQGDELALWHLDQAVNDRGVLVDVALTEAAIRAVERAQKSLAARTVELTDSKVQAATQRDALLRHLTESHGLDLPDMKQSTLERRIADPDLPAELRDLLGIRLQASTTSTSKYKTLSKAVSNDNRLRGTLQFNGASRTGRWAGRLFQPQNLPRPSLKQTDIEYGIAAMKADCADLLFENVMALTSSAIRSCIVAPAGSKLIVADLCNIEGRMIAWLAGEEWKLQAFRDYDAGTGHDLYKLAYAKAFAVSPDSVDKDRRQIGKVMELMLGYEGGVGAFLTGAATYGIDLDAMADAAWPSITADVIAEAEQFLAWRTQSRMGHFGLKTKTFIVCDALKRLWRRAHPAVASLWKDLEETARMAVLRPGGTYECRMLKLRRDGAWLRIRLPSGRFLCYPSPHLDDGGKLSYMGVNQYSRKWSRLRTYGGKLAENVTQAASRDVLAANMPAIEAAGYRIVLSVHDENITEADDTDEFTPGKLAALMATNPPWSKGLPLAAAGFEAYRYRKD
ncbi:DNA polymerase [Haematospirillum jordaniae]|uniref:DNA polymerase n=1 Tax=Haematospirillum jordaniae TaxID=1549855 RepID=UPI0014329C24|nr:DNA polymerase [Haematospirillum jordaniae]NKD93118.1 DNA polymerase I [Haematospirillum jordaniae]